ncbi:MAG: GNAT family N-acetyltransferase [Candidatus Tenebribacter burtonii]|jgi:predicted acetyltransferase|nr:GNAT family N-acetyltransferase [Candidatus Tenebribacter burtonii]
MQIKSQICLNKYDVTIVDAKPEQEEIYRNLVNLQFHDLSEFRDSFDILEDGRFEWTFSDCFKPNNEHHHPLLILCKDRIVGFLIFSVFNGKHPEVDFQLVEMFVLKMYRKKGVGKQVIEIIFDNYKGKYHLDVSEKNIPAIKFWEKLIEKHSNQIFKKPFKDEGNKYINYIFVI